MHALDLRNSEKEFSKTHTVQSRIGARPLAHYTQDNLSLVTARMAEPGRIGGRLPTEMLADQSTLSQLGGADYAHPITTRPPRFTDLSPSLVSNIKKLL